MPDLWLPGAERHPLSDTAPTDTQYAPRVIWHITWDKNGTAAKPADLVPFDQLVRYFTGAGSGMAPHLLWDPFTGRTAQFYPATSRSKSVVDSAGGTRTNRTGRVCLQVETLFFPYCRVNGRSYATVRNTPAKGLDKILAWARSWGVPDTWPMGSPTWSANRSERTWETRGGHYGHSQVPENQHTDPGPMPKWSGTTAYVPPPFPAGLTPGKSNPSAKPLQKALRAAGFLNITDADLSDAYGPRTQTAVGRFFDAHPQFRDQGKPHDVAIGPHGWTYLFTLAYGHK
ncbi:peptidoglycan-binding protein [Streptomyces sp. NPDC017958]|uniref:peptidoglycan-binding protein n=1 Tax=Streptomyces sp. NPDC017958 TaxID=3365021 RepID=UPI003789FAC8